MNLHKALRFLVPEEIKALLEKIDSLDRYDSSSYPLEQLVRTGKFTKFERKLLRNAIDRVQRRQTLSDAMHVVIYGYTETSGPHDEYAGRIFSSNLGESLKASIDRTFTTTAVGRKRAISYVHTGL